MLTHTGTNGISDDAVGLLLECHGRIRAFVELASRLAHVEGVSAGEIADRARTVGRYFADALPQHADDEELSLLPRLAGRDRQVDAALVRMHHDHLGHAAVVARVAEVCGELAASPARHAALSPALGAAAAALREHLERHLALEEEIVFPALRTLLAAGARAEIVRELRSRWDHSSR